MSIDMETFNEQSFYRDDNSNYLPCHKSGVQTVNVYDDDNIMALVRAVQQTEYYTPLIKEELKMKIQERRLASGKGELIVQETPPEKMELSPVDVQRREIRKEQNRRAARRYRNKQRAKASVVRKEMDQLENDNTMLMNEIKKLHQEKNELFQILQSHLQECLVGQLTLNPETWALPELPLE